MIQALLVIILLSPGNGTHYRDLVRPADSMATCEMALPAATAEAKATGLRFVIFCAPVTGGMES